MMDRASEAMDYAEMATDAAKIFRFAASLCISSVRGPVVLYNPLSQWWLIVGNLSPVVEGQAEMTILRQFGKNTIS